MKLSQTSALNTACPEGFLPTNLGSPTSKRRGGAKLSQWRWWGSGKSQPQFLEKKLIYHLAINLFSSIFERQSSFVNEVDQVDLRRGLWTYRLWLFSLWYIMPLFRSLQGTLPARSAKKGASQWSHGFKNWLYAVWWVACKLIIGSMCFWFGYQLWVLQMKL